eukprot:366097-Chlamydomonas_euryale.AAC.11
MQIIHHSRGVGTPSAVRVRPAYNVRLARRREGSWWSHVPVAQHTTQLNLTCDRIDPAHVRRPALPDLHVAVPHTRVAGVIGILSSGCGHASLTTSTTRPLPFAMMGSRALSTDLLYVGFRAQNAQKGQDAQYVRTDFTSALSRRTRPAIDFQT